MFPTLVAFSLIDLYFSACPKATCDDYNISRSHCLSPNYTQLMGNLCQPIAFERLDWLGQLLGTKNLQVCLMVSKYSRIMPVKVWILNKQFIWSMAVISPNLSSQYLGMCSLLVSTRRTGTQSSFIFPKPTNAFLSAFPHRLPSSQECPLSWSAL